MSNPDLIALRRLKQVLETFNVTYPDGATGYFDEVDIGYQSAPSHFPYVSLHTVGSRAPVRHLGQGANTRARMFEIDAVIAIEYEHPDPLTGFERLTQLRWDVHLHLIENGRIIEGVDFVDFDEATVQTYTPDEGNLEDWGFYGQILMPITITMNGTTVAANHTP